MAELDEGERNGIEEEHCAYDAADGPSQYPQRVSFIHRRPFKAGRQGSAARRQTLLCERSQDLYIGTLDVSAGRAAV